MNPNLDEPIPIGLYGNCIAPASLEQYHNQKTALELTAPVVTAAIAAAGQNRYNVQPPDMPAGPISVNVLLSVGSGEGKDLTAKFFEAHRDCQQDNALSGQDEAERHEFLEKIWRLEDRALMAEYAFMFRKGEPTEEIRARIAAHLHKRPRPKSAGISIFSNTTIGALQESLCTVFPSAIIFNLEAGAFLKRLGLPGYGAMNSNWSGAPINYNRTDGVRLSVAAPRTSSVLGIQPGILIRVMKSLGADAKDSGFWARFLMSCAPSPYGAQHVDATPKSSHHFGRHKECCKHLLEEGAELTRGTNDERIVLQFSEPGQRLFRDIRKMLQDAMRLHGSLHQEREMGARQAEQAVRLAAVLHLADGLDGPIAAETLDRAAWIVRWHALQYLRFVSSTTALAHHMQDAQVLEGCLVQARWRGQSLIRRSDLWHICPPDWAKSRVEKAWGLLMQSGRGREDRWERMTLARLSDSAPPAHQLIAQPNQGFNKAP